MFTGNLVRQYILILLVSLILLSGLVMNYKHPKNIPFTCVLISSFILVYTIAMILHKPLPTDRILLPFYPILVLSICEILPWIVDRIRSEFLTRYMSIGLVLATFLFLTNFVLSINLLTTRDWRENYPLKDLVYDSFIIQKPIPNEKFLRMEILSFLFTFNRLNIVIR